MDPKKTALILVGFQNDYFAKDGILRGVVEEPNRVDTVLANALRFVDAMKDTGLTILSTPIVLEPDYRALASPVGILHAIKESGAFRAGTSGAETIPELLAFGDRVLYVTGKVGFNAFSNTRLDDVLRVGGITNVLVCGMVTSLCIDSTGRLGVAAHVRATRFDNRGGECGEHRRAGGRSDRGPGGGGGGRWHSGGGPQRECRR